MRLPVVSSVVDLTRAQVELVTQLPATLLALNRSIRRLAVTVEQTQETVLALQRLVVRVDRLATQIEEPVALLTPGLRRAARVLDDPIIDTIPVAIRRIEAEVMPVLRNLRDTEAKVARIATSTERLTGLVDDAGRSLSGLPGATLFGMRRRPPVPPDEPSA